MSNKPSEADASEQRAYFVIGGLAQPLKLKLAVKSSLKNLFAHVPFSHAQITPDFFWQELKLDPNCCPSDYGMQAGPNHVHHIDARIPPLSSNTGDSASKPHRDSATAKVYSSLHPMELLGALTQSPVPKSSPPKVVQSNGHSQGGTATVSSAATARLIDELQYAVKVHSESAMRLNEQLLATQKDLAEVTDVMTAENRKLTNRTLELEEHLRAKELQRQEQVQQSISSIHQHFTAFEHEREARREEVESLQKLVKAINQEKDVFAQRNEELSRTLHQRDEEWATDLEHFTAQIKKSQHTTLQLEGRVAELSGVQSENHRLAKELERTRPIAEREPMLLDEIEKLRQQVDSLQSHLVSSNASVLSLQSNLTDSKERYEKEVRALRYELSDKDRQLHESLERSAARPSEAQLHAKIREVVAHNQRLVQLIKQPSGATSQGAYSPSVPPGVRGSPYNQYDPHKSGEVSQSHWNESVQRAGSYDHAKSALERMYPPADSITEPAARHDDRPSAPRLSQRQVREEPVVVTRQEVRRESVRAWADELGPRSSPPRGSEYGSMRATGSMRQPSPVAGTPTNGTANINRSRSDLRGGSPPASGGNLQNSRGSMRMGEPVVPQHRAASSVSLSRSPSHRDGSTGGQQQPEPQRRASIRAPTTPNETEAPRVPLSRGPQSMRQPSPAQREELRASKSVGDMRTQQQQESVVVVTRAAEPPLVREPSSFQAPRDSGGEVEAHYNNTPRGSVVPRQGLQQQPQEPQQQQPQQLQQHQQPLSVHEDIMVEFEDEANPHEVNTLVLPPHSRESFVPSTGAEPGLVIIESPEPVSVLADDGSGTVSRDEHASRVEENRNALKSRGGSLRVADSRPRQEPEIDAERVPFSKAKSAFMNSAPLTGPAAPYVAPIRRVQSSGSVPRGAVASAEQPPREPAWSPQPQPQEAEEAFEDPQEEDHPEPMHFEEEPAQEEPVVVAPRQPTPTQIPALPPQIPTRDPTSIPRVAVPRSLPIIHAAAPSHPVRESPKSLAASGSYSFKTASNPNSHSEFGHHAAEADSATPQMSAAFGAPQVSAQYPFQQSSIPTFDERSGPQMSATFAPTQSGAFPFHQASMPSFVAHPGQPSPGMAHSMLDTPRRPAGGASGDEVSEPNAEGSATPTSAPPLNTTLSPRVHLPGNAVELPTKRISYEPNGIAAERFGTIGEVLAEAAASGNARSVAIFNNGGEQVTLSWKKYLKTAKTFAKALLGDAAGVGTRIAFLGDNSAEFSVAYLGSVMCGCVPVVINHKLAAEEVRRQVDQTFPRILLVDSPKTLNTCIMARAKMPSFRRMVVAHGVIPPRLKESYRDLVFTFDEYLDKARFATPEAINEREQSFTAESCATIAFTSGTTQQARPVMLSHDNLLFAAWSLAHAIQLKTLTQADGNVRIASCSMHSDVVYQVTDVILPLVASAKFGLNVTTYYSRAASSNVNAAVSLLQTAKPTVFLGSPQLWMSLFALAAADAPASARGFLGLSDARLLLWGGADWNLSQRTNVFDKLGFDVHQFYSTTETAGILTTSSASVHDYASCGATIPGCEIRTLNNPDRDEDPEYGDMEVYGRNVAIGYLNYPTMTEEYFSQDGFFRTGDVGKKDPDDLVFLKGRDWDFIQNSKGEYVSIRAVEDSLQAGCKAASRVVIVGANRPSLVCLIALKAQRDEAGRITGDLAAEAAQINPNLRTIAEARADEQVRLYISSAIREYNNGLFCPSPAHRVKQFIFFRTEPSYDEDLVTINGKLRRSMILEKYSTEIDNAYDQKPRKPSKREIRSPIGDSEDALH